MKEKLVPSAWLHKEGRRLDCGPYLSGAVEAKLLLESIAAKKQPLQKVTKNGLAGIFNGPRFPRTYVSDPRYGVPFLGSTDILAANLAHLPLLSKKQVAAQPELLVDEGWTLITCSGTVGRMAYARSDMRGMAGSQHFMRVVPDTDVIHSGFLYAFLSSSFGVPLVAGGTYGAIIQHIEPAHIADLPIPRLGDHVEQAAHALVVEAASSRVEASLLLQRATRAFLEEFDLEEPRPTSAYETPSVVLQSSRGMLERFDAYYYAPWNCDARLVFDRVSERAPLGELVDALFIPGFFKRIYASDPAYGYPYLTGSDVYELVPKAAQYLSRRVPDVERLVLKSGMILVQDSGQLGGLIGRPVLVGRNLDGFACTNNMVRIVPKSPTDQGYLFAVLNNEYGVRLLTREATGSSIPHLEEKRVRRIEVPWPGPAVRKRIGEPVLTALELRDRACELEHEAVGIVCAAIEKGR